MQPFTYPNDATHNIYSTGFRDIQVQKCEIFVTQRQVTPKWVVWFGPKTISTKFLCLSSLTATLMMIQSNMNKLHVAWRNNFPIISLWNFFRCSRTANSVVSGPVWPKSSEILCMSSLPASIKSIGSKATGKRWLHHFPHYKSMEAFCCHGHQSFDPICRKTLCSLSPPQWCYT